MFIPDNDQGQYWWLANTGASPEDEYIAAICGILDDRPKGCAVDVGANFGCWTLPLSKHAHSVVAFEPQRVCFDLIGKSLSASKIRNVRLLNAAAGAVGGRITVPDLDLDQATNFGGITLAIPHHEQPSAPLVEVDMVKLDTVLRGESVTFIKIDVEGFEARVIEGARDTIRRCHPILFAEMDHSLTDADKLKADIEAMGYAIEKWGGNFLGMPL